MFLKLQRPIIFFDLETTGTDVEKDRIIELAAIEFTPDGMIHESKRMRFNPGVPIPPEATAVHGFTDEDVKNCPSFGSKASAINDSFKGCDLGGYNIIRFDIPMLQSELGRCGYTLDLSVDIIDVMQIYHQREPRNLEAAVRKYTGKEHTEAHSALEDVKATIDVLKGQMEVYDDLPRTPCEIYEQLRDPDQVDFAGKIRWVGDDMTLTFGKEAGKPFRQIPTGYFHWIRKNGVVGPDVMHVISLAIDGRYLSKEEWEYDRARFRGSR